MLTGQLEDWDNAAPTTNDLKYYDCWANSVGMETNGYLFRHETFGDLYPTPATQGIDGIDETTTWMLPVPNQEIIRKSNMGEIKQWLDVAL